MVGEKMNLEMVLSWGREHSRGLFSVWPQEVKCSKYVPEDDCCID
jgi:hypothetical protein